MRIRQKVLTCGESTPTGRIYPLPVMLDAVAALVGQITRNELFGQPYNISDPHRLSLSDVSHLTRSVELVNCGLWVEVELLDTPRGMDLQMVKMPLRIVPIGLGSLSRDGVVQPDFKLLRFDLEMYSL
jgi:hypothetical protein